MTDAIVREMRGFRALEGRRRTVRGDLTPCRRAARRFADLRRDPFDHHSGRPGCRSATVVSWVNLVDVYYRIERDHGRDAADDTLTALRRKLSPDLPGTAKMIEAGRLKTRAPIALADCFAAATAAAHCLVLLTGDPELVELVDSPCVVEDLRRS